MTALRSAYLAVGKPRLILAVVVEDVYRVRVSHEGTTGTGRTFEEALAAMLAIRAAAYGERKVA